MSKFSEKPTTEGWILLNYIPNRRPRLAWREPQKYFAALIALRSTSPPVPPLFTTAIVKGWIEYPASCLATANSSSSNACGPSVSSF